MEAEDFTGTHNNLLSVESIAEKEETIQNFIFCSTLKTLRKDSKTSKYRLLDWNYKAMINEENTASEWGKKIILKRGIKVGWKRHTERKKVDEIGFDWRNL